MNIEWVNAYFDRGIDLGNRRVFLGEIDDESVDTVIKGFYLMEQEDPDKPIELFMNSPGGCIYGSLAIHDIMQTIRCPIHTFAYGRLMSAAPLLLACGEPGHRWVTSHLKLMHHDGADEIVGKTTSIISDLKHLQELDKDWTEVFCKYTTKTFKWWDDRAKRSGDFFFSADQALEWGIADSVWVEK